MEKNKQMSEAFLTGAVLAVVGGFLDAYTYICRGAVFANAQTGNIVLMGIRLADRDFSGAVYYIIPIIAFVAGVLISEIIRNLFRKSRLIHWRQIILAFETAVLILVAFIPADDFNNLISNTLISFVCSLQVQSFRTVNGNAIATTMCTGNLRSAAEMFFRYTATKRKTYLNRSFQYSGIIIFFIMGAAIGTVFTKVFEVKAVLFACIGLIIIFILLFKTAKAAKPNG